MTIHYKKTHLHDKQNLRSIANWRRKVVFSGAQGLFKEFKVWSKIITF